MIYCFAALALVEENERLRKFALQHGFTDPHLCFSCGKWFERKTDSIYCWMCRKYQEDALGGRKS